MGDECVSVEDDLFESLANKLDKQIIECSSSHVRDQVLDRTQRQVEARVYVRFGVWVDIHVEELFDVR